MIERKIIIGLITSTKFLTKVKEIWSPELIGSTTARRISDWCWEYYNEFEKAPGNDIQDIFFTKLKDKNIPKDVAEEIEDDIFPSLSSESTKKKQNVKYLLKKSKKYFKRRSLEILHESVEALLAKGEIKEAEQLAQNFQAPDYAEKQYLDFNDKKQIFDRIRIAFNTEAQNLIYYPHQLGDFLNEHLVRGGFVSFLAPEKRGKTFLLLDLAMRAVRQKRKVAFFQAGDMNETQQLIRICIYLTKTSNKEKYCGKQWQVTRDCVLNQINDCDLADRECDFGVFEDKDTRQVRKEITKEELIEAYENHPGYKPCYNCQAYKTRSIGAPWLEPIIVDGPIDSNDAERAVEDFFIKHKRYFRLSTHPNNSLSVNKAKAIKKEWEKEGFISDVDIFDYGDIMVANNQTEERHKQNAIYKDLRNNSQTGNEPLTISVTQSDADSYDRNSLSLKNFSESKSKYAHVTAMFGINQDPNDRERKIGIMRLNELAVREGEKTGREVTVLQNLKRGRPFLGSFW